MKYKSFVCSMLAGMFLFVVAGCSGGDGSGNTVPTKAVVVLSVSGTVGAGEIKGAQLTLKLPAGVTVAADGTGQTEGRLVAASGEAFGGDAYVVAKYIPATGTENGSIRAVIVKTSGFGAGEFLTVICNLSGGTPVSASAFSVADFKAVDEDGAAIAGLEAKYTVVNK